MKNVGFYPAWVALSFVVGGCSAILPLGPDFTFDEDGGRADASVDASMMRDAATTDAQAEDAGVDAGCVPVPTMAEACADRCGSVTVCGMSFACGDCAGELTCGGGGTANQCACATSPCTVFSAAFGDANEQRLTAIAVDFEGNVIVAGDFRGTIVLGSDTHTNVGATRYDIFLAKLDPTGAVLWSRSYGGVEDATTDRDQTAVDVTVDGAGNVILAARVSGVVNFGGTNLNTSSDIALVKLTSAGAHVFSAAYGTDFVAYPTRVTTDPASYDIFLVGDFWGTLRFGTLGAMTAAGTDAYFDMFLVRFDPDGTPRYSRRYGDGSDQNAAAVAVAGSHVYFAGAFNGSFDFGAPSPTPLSTTSWYALAIAKLGSGTYNHVWSRQVGTDVSSALIATDVAGNLYVSGSFGGTLDITTPALTTASYDAFLAKLDVNGATLWARQYPNLDIQALSVGADGSVYFAGRARGDVDLGDGTITYSGSQDAFVAHLSPSGDHVFSRVFSAPVGNQAAYGVGEAPDGSVWVGARFEGQLDFGVGEHRTAGGNDVGVARLVP